MSSPSDIEMAQIKATLRKLALVADGVEYAVMLTALETFAATTLAIAGGDPTMVAGFCTGVTEGCVRIRASIDREKQS